MRNAADVAISEESGKHCSKQCRHLLLSEIDASNNHGTRGTITHIKITLDKPIVVICSR